MILFLSQLFLASLLLSELQEKGLECEIKVTIMYLYSFFLSWQKQVSTVQSIYILMK